MKNRLLPLTLALILSIPLAGMLRAAEPKHEHKEPDTELGKTMEKLNGAWRKLRKQAADPASNASSLELVAAVKAGLEKALEFKPAKADDLPAADREKFVQDFRAQLKDVITQVAKLEAAFKANNNTEALELLQKIGGMQKDSHKEFKRPDM